jgi:TyrR family helix-turn-helix protein
VSCRSDCINQDSFHGFIQNDLVHSCADLSTLKKAHELEERQAIVEAYRRTGSTRKTAAMLGISQPAVVKKMKKYGISADRSTSL